MDRHVRQARLREVGPEGQARIAAGAVVVRLDGEAADYAARYLAGAGVASLRVRERGLADGARALAPEVRVEVDAALAAAAEGEPEALALRDPAARDLAEGALAALRALRGLLEEPR